jgi:predicted ATPase with chaperone activity
MISGVHSSNLQGIDAVACEVEADVKKDSAAFDLPIAIAACIAGRLVQTDKAQEYLIVGEYDVDFAGERGQESAKRALAIAAGHHNVIFIGLPGAGKNVAMGLR